jgi:hypothetical protein
MKLNIHTIGAELGYQFVLWRRLSLDFLVFGPGFAFYKLDAGLKTDLLLTQQDKEKITGEIKDALHDRFPGFNLVASENSEKEFQSKDISIERQRRADIADGHSNLSDLRQVVFGVHL